MRISDWSSDVCSSDLTAIGVGALSIVDGITVIALARDDQIALTAAEIVQRNALEIVLRRGITPDRTDQTRRCRTAGLGIETPQCDILFGDIDRACRIVGDAAFGLRPELEIADLAQRSLAAGPCDDLPLAVEPVGIAREDEGPPIPGAAIHAQPKIGRAHV